LVFCRAFSEPRGDCVGNAVYFDNAQSGALVGSNYATATASQSVAHLRLRREGNTYTGYYSDDGANWTVIGQHTNSMASLKVGLYAAQAYQGETTADFEYFTITTLP
jgi:beta-xylosidase